MQRENLPLKLGVYMILSTINSSLIGNHEISFDLAPKNSRTLCVKHLQTDAGADTWKVFWVGQSALPLFYRDGTYPHLSSPQSFNDCLG